MIRSCVTISLVPEARGGPFVFWDDLAAGCDEHQDKLGVFSRIKHAAKVRIIASEFDDVSRVWFVCRHVIGIPQSVLTEPTSKRAGFGKSIRRDKRSRFDHDLRAERPKYSAGGDPSPGSKIVPSEPYSALWGSAVVPAPNQSQPRKNAAGQWNCTAAAFAPQHPAEPRCRTPT